MRTQRLHVEKTQEEPSFSMVSLGTGEASSRKWLGLGFSAAADAN